MSNKGFITIITIATVLYAIGRAKSVADLTFLLLVAVPLVVGIFLLFFRWVEKDLKRQQRELEEQERRVRAIQIADVDDMAGLEFEHYVAKLLQNEGYQARVTKGSGDLGVDILAEKNGASYAVQVKRHIKQVSRRAVSDAVAGKIHYQCSSCMVITNSYFSSGAKQMAASTGCELIDRDTLTNWIIAFQSGVPNVTLQDVVDKQNTSATSEGSSYRSRKGRSTLSSIRKSYKANIKRPTYSTPSRRSKKNWW